MQPERLVHLLRSITGGHLVVVTGAGVSLASGIPTFRGDDPGAVWKHDVTELGTRNFFERDPVTSWQWSSRLFGPIDAAEPNDAHRALVDLQDWFESPDGGAGRFTLVTQNIDGLHARAGSRDVVEVHGSVHFLRCAHDGQGGSRFDSEPPCRLAAPRGRIPRAEHAEDLAAFRADPSLETLPRCPACGALLRRHVLWFDEYYQDHVDYAWPRIEEATESADAILFVGTSFAVTVVHYLLEAGALRGIPMVSIDPAPLAPRPVVAIEAKAEILLRNVADRLVVPS